MCLLGREVRLRRDDRLGAVISRVELHARRLDEARAPAELEVEIVEAVQVGVVAAVALAQLDVEHGVVRGTLV